MLTDSLLLSLFDGKPHPLAPLLVDWLGTSRRFAAFVSANETKIRKKLRSTREPESLRDLQLELETAYLLLQERSLSVAYEPQPGKLGRSPDFAVSYNTSQVFMVEVTRMRAEPASGIADMLSSKLGQLAQQSSNLIVVGIEAAPPAAEELRAAMLRLQQRAEAGDPAILQRAGFRDRSDFFQRYYRLSTILMRHGPLQPGDPVIFWDNPQARYPLPARVRTALLRSHALQ